MTHDLEEAKRLLAPIRDHIENTHGVNGTRKTMGTGITHSNVSGIKGYTGYHLIVYVKPEHENVKNEIPISYNGIPIQTKTLYLNFIKPYGEVPSISSLQVFPGTYRPLRPGSSFGLMIWDGSKYYNSTGTLGAILKDNYDGSTVLLTNNHVIANDMPNQNLFSTSTEVWQPGPSDGGSGDDKSRVGKNKRRVTLQWQHNLVDAAIAAPFEGIVSDTFSIYIQLDQNYLCNYRVKTEIAEAYVGMPIMKTGRTTGCTYGTVEAVHVNNLSLLGGVGSVSERLYFDDQIIIKSNDKNPIAGEGDSGSLCVSNDGNYNPVGLLFAGGQDSSGVYTIAANRIANVLSALNLSFIPAWGSYTKISGAALAGTGTSINASDTAIESGGYMYVSVIGTDYKIYVTSYNDLTGVWSSWQRISNGYSLNTPALIRSIYWYSIVVGTNGYIYMSRADALLPTPPVGWSTYSLIPGGGTAMSRTGVSGVSNYPYITIAVVGTDSKIYTNSMNVNSGSWSGWKVVPNGYATSTPAIVQLKFNGPLYLMVVSADTSIWINNTDSYGNWVGWYNIGGNALAGTGPSLATDGTLLYASVIGTDSNIYVRNLNVASGIWSSWVPSYGSSKNTPAIFYFHKQLYSVVAGLDSSIWINRFN